MPTRLLPPATRRRSEPPRWEVTDDAGTVLGWIEERHLRGAAATFYAATARHPRTGREVGLELSTSFEERLDVLRRFAADPSEFSQHLGWQG